MAAVYPVFTLTDEVTTAFPVICKLSVESVPDLVRIDAECTRPPWSDKLFRDEFNNKHTVVYGARLAGALVGFLALHVVLDEAHVLTFGVQQNVRGQGIGRQLIDYMLTELTRRGVGTIMLEVRTSNVAARSLYRSVGFGEVGLRERYYLDNREDAVLMNLDLRAR